MKTPINSLLELRDLKRLLFLPFQNLCLCQKSVGNCFLSFFLSLYEHGSIALCLSRMCKWVGFHLQFADK